MPSCSRTSGNSVRGWGWSLYSTGGKTRLGRITKRGDVYLRTLLVHGARAALTVLTKRIDRLST